MPFSLNRYTDLFKIADGGMSEILRAVDRTSRQTVIIKKMVLNPAHQSFSLEKFYQEARNASLLKHPNIISIIDHGIANNAYYIVMEYIDGCDLNTLLSDVSFNPEIGLMIVFKALLALRFLHTNGLIHCDIKPSNLLIDKVGRVVLSDFGISRVKTHTMLAQNDFVDFTTPLFMPPEQAKLIAQHFEIGYDEWEETSSIQYNETSIAQKITLGDRKIQWDIWSVGVLLYYVCSGYYPFNGDNFSNLLESIKNSDVPDLNQFVANIPEPLVKTINLCLKKEPEQRPHALDPVLHALQHYFISRGIKGIDQIIAEYMQDKMGIRMVFAGDDSLSKLKSSTIQPITRFKEPEWEFSNSQLFQTTQQQTPFFWQDNSPQEPVIQEKQQSIIQEKQLPELTDALEHADLTDAQEHADLTDAQEQPELTDVQEQPELTDVQEQPELTDVQEQPELTDVQEQPELTDVQEHAELTDVQEQPELTDLQEHADLTDLQEHADLTDLQEHADLTDLQEHADLTDLQKHADLTDLQEHADLTDLQLLISSTENSQLAEKSLFENYPDIADKKPLLHSDEITHKSSHISFIFAILITLVLFIAGFFVIKNYVWTPKNANTISSLHTVNTPDTRGVNLTDHTTNKPLPIRDSVPINKAIKPASETKTGLPYSNQALIRQSNKNTSKPSAWGDETIEEYSSKAEPQVGTFTVTINPPEAMVFVDDSQLDGNEITNGKDIIPGIYTIRAKAPGYVAYERTIQIEPNKTLMLAIELKSDIKGSGQLHIYSYPWANLYIDNALVGTTPTPSPIPLVEGRHQIQLKRDGYLPYDEFVTIKNGETTRLQIQLTKAE